MSRQAVNRGKSFERRVAKRLGGKRIPSTGERDGADVIVGDVFAVQCKNGRAMPSYLREWLNGIQRAAGGQRTGIVVWKAAGRGRHASDDDAVVVLSLKDWEALHGSN